MQALNVWMNGELVGTWAVDRGSHAFNYAQSWVESEHRRSLSLSIPISASLEAKGPVVRNYFDNLLPDNDQIRSRIGKRFSTKSTEVFDLLEAIGRDCVGAVQLLPAGEEPVGWDQIQADALSEDEIVDLLHAVPSEGMAEISDDELIRISIAGAQEKTALTLLDGQWCRPRGATPTTHIIKLPLGLIGGMRRVDAWDSVENEWVCAKILEALGLPVAATSVETFGDQKVLVVERFDRAWMGDSQWIARLPQEDFCQALGVPPDKKYEQDGGPGMDRCLSLLQGSEDRWDRTFFLLTQLAFFFLAATDGHAKNFSIHLRRGDAYEMTPLYDVLSMWPYFGDSHNKFKERNAGLAMAIRSKNAHYRLYTIHAGHWHQLAMRNGGQDVWKAMLELVSNANEALAAVEKELPEDFPARTWSAISSGVKRQAARFFDEVKAESLMPEK